MPGLKHFESNEGADAIVSALREDGAVVVLDLLAPELVEALNADVTPHLETADPGMKHLNPAIAWFFGDRTRHVSGMPGKSRRFAVDVMCHPLLLEVCDQVLLPACASYQLNLGHLIDRGPGADAQVLHRDELVWSFLPVPHPEVQVATIVALEDFTSEIGATRVVPGSHRWPRDRQPEPHEVVDAVMPAGAAVLYLGSTIHGGGANGSADRWRRGLHLSYALGWLRTEENNLLAVPPELARTLPRRAQELLGYAVHDAIEHGGGYLGMLGLRDPVDLLESGEL